MDQLSDQAALPNINANWVNAKGMVPPTAFCGCTSKCRPYKSRIYGARHKLMIDRAMADSTCSSRCLDHSSCPHFCAQDII